VGVRAAHDHDVMHVRQLDVADVRRPASHQFAISPRREAFSDELTERCAGRLR